MSSFIYLLQRIIVQLGNNTNSLFEML